MNTGDRNSLSLYSERMRTRRFRNSKEEEMKDGEPVPFSGSSNYGSVCLHLPLGTLDLGL